VRYQAANDAEALAAFHRLCRLEGVIPALESSHALHVAGVLAGDLNREDIVLVCLSGRGDKDIDTVRQLNAGKAPA
jgi:tryptophan synthase beta chain